MESRVLETIIYGRVEPHIYAFQTQKVPRYTKVGDTYRPTEIRLTLIPQHYSLTLFISA